MSAAGEELAVLRPRIVDDARAWVIALTRVECEAVGARVEALLTRARSIRALREVAAAAHLRVGHLVLRRERYAVVVWLAVARAKLLGGKVATQLALR